jgi:IclR family KDG regulon transcriptional repressor
MVTQSKADPRRSQSLLKAFDILEAIAAHHRPMGVTEIARAVGINKATVHRLLRTLADRGYVRQVEPAGAYSLGFQLLALGNEVLDSLDLVNAARPIMQELSDISGETVFLYVYDRGAVTLVHSVESSQAVRASLKAGRNVPIHATAAGKVFLAFLDGEILRQLERIRLKRYTERTIQNVDELRQQLEVIRSTDIAFDNGEYLHEVWCISTPIRNHRHEVIAALSLAGPEHRIETSRRQNLVELVRQAGVKLSQQLGWRPDLPSHAVRESAHPFRPSLQLSP